MKLIKAIFMDYYGTVVHETGPIVTDVIKQIYENSNAERPEEIFSYWQRTFRKKIENANGKNFRTQHDVALENFEELLEYFKSSEVPEKLLEHMEKHWYTTPIYDDARAFLMEVKLPIYFVTNSDDKYVHESLKNQGLHPTGVITSEQARYSKPRREIFLYALEKTGLNPEEVIHIGDSLESDVYCPNSVGISSIWLNREAKVTPDGVASVEGFWEILKMLNS